MRLGLVSRTTAHQHAGHSVDGVIEGNAIRVRPPVHARALPDQSHDAGRLTGSPRGGQALEFGRCSFAALAAVAGIHGERTADSGDIADVAVATMLAASMKR